MKSSLPFLGLGLGFFALALGACTVDNSISPGSGQSSGGGASADEVDRCKKSCDKMKFFDCSSADEQARCYADCEKATASQVQVFTGCAESSICDPECRTTIQPKDAPKQGSGGSSSSCVTACEKLTSCSLIPLSQKGACNAECTSKGYQYQVDCVSKTTCDKIVGTCGGVGANPNDGKAGSSGTPEPNLPDTSISDCEIECDQLNFFDCVSIEDHSSCRDACKSKSSSKRTTFTGCSSSSGLQCDRKKACLDAFLK